MALDLTLRIERRSSLDDVMRALWKRYGVTDIGLSENSFASVVSEVSGIDLSEFFARYVDGTHDPPLAELFTAFGITLMLRQASGSRDRSGKPPRNGDTMRCFLGAKWSNEMKLQYVDSAGPAERAGLAPGDTLVAIDGVKASNDSIAMLLERSEPGRTIRVHAFRRDELRTFDVSLQSAPLDTCYLMIDSNASDDAQRRRNEWLSPR